MKKPIILMSILSTLLLSACGQSAAPQSAAPNADTSANTSPKIASLSIHLTNDLLALSITPVGSVIGGQLKTFLPHVADKLKDTKQLGPVSDPDMESLLSLQPDAIYLDEKYSGKDLPKYEKIAQTHVFNLDKGTWRDHLKEIGKLVHREKQADDFIKDYDAQAEHVRTLISNKIGNGKVMAIRVTAKELRVFGMKRPMGPILFHDLKLQPAKGVEKINKAYEVISQEVLPDFDADAIFVIIDRDDDAGKTFQQLKSNPIWQGLKAVKANHVYTIKDQPWLDYSALGNKMALDEAEEIFGKK